ncbi:two-component regulator propeller domain-containing protein [Mariniflexile ostreae]|uniref:histidine kinase n=1 Tax=Mariniflexile ostreae TaxID=1520892 RepID=A0ABV5FBS7_9FLAO
MRKTKLKYLSFLLFVLCIHSFSQDRTISFTHLSAKDGLSQNGVMAIFKDSKGFMWFGTRDGLNRYDGYSFKVFRHNNLISNSLSNNFITVIKEDNEGILWIGTDNGLNSFDRSTETFKVYTTSSTNNHSISNNKILSILSCENGDLWVGTENGLNLKKKETDNFERFHYIVNNPNSLSGNVVNTIYEDSKNTIWIGTKYNGLNKLNKKNKQFTAYKHHPKDPNSIRSNDIKAIAESRDHKLWVGTADNGISLLNEDGSFSHFQHNKNSSNSLSNNRVRELLFDTKNNLWIATYNGLNYLNTTNLTFEVYKNSDQNTNTISQNSIRSLYLDATGFLWAGTYFGGINLINLKSKQFKYFQHNAAKENSLSYNVVSAMVEDSKKNVWVGTEGGGLNYFDIKSQSFSRIHEFNGNSINAQTIKSLLIDKNQNLWIGTHLDGLLVLELKSKKIKKFLNNEDDPNSLSDNSILSLTEDNSGTIWIGTENGLNVFNPKTNKISKVQLKDNNISITKIFEDSKKNIWMGTKQNGLLLINNETIKYYINAPNNPQSISHNTIYDIFEDSKKQLWIGTYGGGLNLLNQTENTFTQFRVSDGLINDIVYQIEEDRHKNLWISTPSGLSKFDTNSKKFKNYTPKNGLPIEEFNTNSSLNHSNGNMFFGGFNGAISFNPDDILDSPVGPVLRLTGLKLANKQVVPNDENNLLKVPINDTKTITFSHDQNIFTIDYIALNYAHLGQNQYAYQLEGLESDWNYVDNKRSATYTNLSAGEYTFRVKAANNDGVWSKSPIVLKIIKRPPFWLTTWAYMAYFLLTFIIFLIIRKYFLIKLHLENNLKLEKMEKQQIEDLSQLKLKFFTNISHDFRTPLTLIHGPLQELIKKSNNQDDSHNHLLLIKKNVNLMLRLINQLMDFRKLETNTVSLRLSKEPISPFIKEIMFSFQELAKAKAIKFTFISKVEQDILFFDKNKIEKVLYNLLSNAFKFTPDGGKITVELQYRPAPAKHETNFIEIHIKNSGDGISKKTLDHIFDRFFQEENQIDQTQSGSGVGLSIAKSLIEVHKGYIVAKSKLKKHTKFIIGLSLDDIYTAEDKSKTNAPIEDNSFFTNKPITAVIKKEHTHTILIVEDNLELRNFLSQTLSPEYNIITAENGEVGVTKTREEKPDIILSDIMMPIMTGLELCKILKSDSKTSHIPILLLTARTTSSVELDSYDTGANDFISKPFDIDVLKSKISSMVHSMKHIKNYSRKKILLEDSEINNSSADEEFLEKLSNYIRDNITNPNLNVNKTGKDLGISRVHLYRKVKQITGKSPVEFIRDFRLSAAAKFLEQNNYNVNEVSYKVGFQDVSYFRKCFKKKYGISSTKYSEKNSKTSIN